MFTSFFIELRRISKNQLRSKNFDPKNFWKIRNIVLPKNTLHNFWRYLSYTSKIIGLVVKPLTR